MMGTRRVTPKLITSASTTRAAKAPPKIATLVEVLREARRKETELQRLSELILLGNSLLAVAEI